MVRRGSDSLVQVLVKWNDTPVDIAMWEDKVTLKQIFSRAPTWGQSVSKGGGVVSSSDQEPEVRSSNVQTTGRPKR